MPATPTLDLITYTNLVFISLSLRFWGIAASKKDRGACPPLVGYIFHGM